MTQQAGVRGPGSAAPGGSGGAAPGSGAGQPGSSGTGTPGTGRPGGASRARVAVAVALLLIVIVGVRGATPSGSSAVPWRGYWVLVGVGIEAAFAALLVALSAAARRDGGELVTAVRMRRWLRRILTVALLAMPILLAATYLPGVHRAARRRLPPGSTTPLRPLQHSRPPQGGGQIELMVIYALLAAAVLAGVIACLAVLRRRRPAGPVPQADPELADWQSGDQADLGRAVESGQAALRQVDDARAAIIACYVAMERTLAQAGTSRADADTPDELLARAAADGLLHGGAGPALTEVFYEARYSSHPVPPGRKEAAEDALGELAAELARPPDGALR